MTLILHKEMISTYTIAIQKPLNKTKIFHINQVDEVLVTTLTPKVGVILAKVVIKTIILTKETAEMLVTTKVTMRIKLTVQTKAKMELTVIVRLTKTLKLHKRSREVITTHSSLAKVA